jgi:adenosylmethionine-8-amino-7-oxononanoate aminotransferase
LCFAADFVEPPRREGEVAGALEKVEGMLSRGDYAGIVVEPVVQGAGGMIVQGRGFLRGVRALADRFGVLLIADEVMTGFGRTGKMFACEHEGVTPDLMCLSKGLTAGYMPLGATLTTKKVFDAFYADPREGKTFFHGHTFTGHPLACAVAIASLDLFEKDRVLERIRPLAEEMRATLERLRGKKFVRDVRCVGMVGAVELGDERGEAFPYHWRVGGEVCRRMRDLGLMMRPLGDVVVVMPPLAIGVENFRRLLAGVVESVEWVEGIVAKKRQEVRP